MFGSKKVIGLDIGTSTIKLAEMEVSRKSAKLNTFGYMITPPGTVNSGELVDTNGISHAVKNLIKEVKSKRKNVALGMWGTAVIVKKISIPVMEKNLVAEQIRWEAEQYIPFDINEISLGFHILENAPVVGDTMNVILVAAKQDLVFRYAEVATLAGLKPDVVDCNGFALANCFELNYGQIPGETIGIFNFGAGVTNFVVIESGEVVFYRDIPVGGNSFTSEIHKELGISLEEAEALKVSASSSQEVPDEVHSLISASNDLVAEEVSNSIDFFKATSNGSQLSRVFYSGGSSNLPGLIDRVASTVGAPVEMMDPFLNVKTNKKAFPPEYIEQIKCFSPVSMGLALRKAGDE